MAYNSAQYLQGRVKYQRPSAMLWSENAGSLVTYTDNTTTPATTKTVYVPIGYEINANTTVNVTAINPDYYPTSASISGTTVTYTCVNNLSAGDSVIISGISGGTNATAFNVSGTVLSSGLSSTQFQITVPTTFTASGGNFSNAKVVVSSIYATYISTNSFNAGDYLVITGSSVAGYNGTFVISSASSSNFKILNSTTGTATTAVATALSNFMILSDHNRGPLDFKTTRLEKRERMITGRMRSFWTADKLSLSVNWNNLPSRAYHLNPQFSLVDMTDPQDQSNIIKAGVSTSTPKNPQEYTVDGGAGGAEMLDWYENHTGSFYVYLSYDKYPSFAAPDAISQYAHLKEYSQVMEMFISSFDYSVEKRGGSNYDLWNISLTLEEA